MKFGRLWFDRLRVKQGQASMTAYRDASHLIYCPRIALEPMNKEAWGCDADVEVYREDLVQNLLVLPSSVAARSL